MIRAGLAVLLLAAALFAGEVSARTVYRCVRDGTVSLATAPEPGSECFAKQLDDGAALVPNLWGSLGIVHGKLYRREQDGRTVYSTRNLPGSAPVLAFTAATPPGSPAHEGLGKVGQPRLAEFKPQFKAAAKATGLDEAWLRAIAHAESAYDASALSEKGAQGVMQLMPETSREYGVKDPFSAKASIDGGARLLRDLRKRYEGDLTLVAAAYNAGIGAVEQYGGVPPYAETQAYVAKVQALYARYRIAMGLKPLPAQLQAAE
ncbi:lytic transglycosylase domain-containing protein [Dokdonella ginsengisoli]|uniref:Lytic transglycosylase domain-containing protein n=1 Tax=Dokdonella ginsengisoli TaxID=363846 RepID=A0ABV9QUV1_9GAMM